MNGLDKIIDAHTVRVSQGCRFEVSRVFWKFQGCLKKVLRVLTKSFKGVSSKFQECFKEVSVKKVPRVFKEDWMAFQVVLRGFQGY